MAQVNKQDTSDSLVWHYTLLTKLQMILNDGLIKPTDVMIDPREKPAVWFSSNQAWEPTATKNIRDEKTGQPREATLARW